LRSGCAPRRPRTRTFALPSISCVLTSSSSRLHCKSGRFSQLASQAAQLVEDDEMIAETLDDAPGEPDSWLNAFVCQSDQDCIDSV
jgi:hypothetical protein